MKSGEIDYLDHAALTALPALLANESDVAKWESKIDRGKGEESDGRLRYGTADAYDDVAEEAYCVAWAMLDARTKFLSKLTTKV